MPSKKIVLFGGTGLLGTAFRKVLNAQEIPYVAPDSSTVDLLHLDQINKFLAQQKPDLIILCAAYTQVDKAESEPEKCQKLNVTTVKNLIASRIPLIHFSSDYVFDAPLLKPHQGSPKDYFQIPEDFAPNPQNIYGKSKNEAEILLENANIPFWNIRTSWLFGPGGSNFVDTVLKLSQEKSDLIIVDDQIGRPTYACDLAHYVVENFILNVQEPGHYHTQNSGEPVSWAEFAEYFLSLKNWSGKIHHTTTQKLNLPAIRPKNSILKNTKIKASLPDWKKRH